jgi:hypothetical protein
MTAANGAAVVPAPVLNVEQFRFINTVATPSVYFYVPTGTAGLVAGIQPASVNILALINGGNFQIQNVQLFIDPDNSGQQP